MSNLIDFLKEKEWEIVYSDETEEKHGKYRDYKELCLSNPSNNVLSSFTDGIYEHQWLAIKEFNNGSNICVSTSTSSGKTLIFHITGIETLNKHSDAKILAIYPLKALGIEQEIRWKKIIKESGLNHKVGRIDGSVSSDQREEIIKNSSIIIITPDVIHAWLLFKITNPHIINFLKKIKLLIIDEAHIYSGVFGSNSSFLYRRLQHLIASTGGNYQIIAASATIKNPSEHLKKLTGLDFYLIDNKYETSPKNRTKIIFVNPPKSQNIITSLATFMKYIASETEYKFITFADSRKQVEYMASISSIKDDDIESISNHLHSNNPSICPYRSGYEAEDRNMIQENLSKGILSGVISTSALEMGIDIPHLNLGILVGIPSSATSFYQRIGRIGRHKEGVIVIVNNGTILTESIFREPHKLKDMPLSESALYLDNLRIQYIHALCLARQGGEDDSIKSFIGVEIEEFMKKSSLFPDEFIELCNSERIGEIPIELQTMKSQAGDEPNRIYLLRDVDIQYKVECKQGPHIRSLGSMSFSQVMREAYPGAVYYYQTEAFRVFRVNTSKRLIEVRPEKKYMTKPNNIPTLIFPNLADGNVILAKKYGNLSIVECSLQIRESIIGFTEARGRSEFSVTYPLDSSSGCYFDINRFTRNYFTTGVIISHPLFNQGSKYVIDILYEAFLMVAPFERQDIGYGLDTHRTERMGFKKDTKFLCVFDKTYGSLRLTSRFIDDDILKKLFLYALEIAKNDERFTKEEFRVLEEISSEIDNNHSQDLLSNKEMEYSDNTSYKEIILPNSVGLYIKDGKNEEFIVEHIFYSPMLGLAYKGRYHLDSNKIKLHKSTDASIIIPIDSLKEIPGESHMGRYNLETGDILN